MWNMLETLLSRTTFHQWGHLSILNFTRSKISKLFFSFQFWIDRFDFSMQYLRAHRANSLFKRRKFFEGSWMGKYSSVFVPGACSSSIMIRLPEIRVKFAPIILYSYLIHIEGEHQFSKGTLLDDPYRRLKAWREMIMLFSRQFFLYTRLKRVRIFIFIFIFRYSCFRVEILNGDASLYFCFFVHAR